MRRANKAFRLTVSLDETEYAAVAAVADRHDASMSWVLRHALHQFLKKNVADRPTAEAVDLIMQVQTHLANQR